MIGRLTTGKSFYHCISYCLEDKKNLSEEEKMRLSSLENLKHKDRAEILFFNNCFGNASELTRQFKDVSNLSNRVEKPVLHISLKLAPGERLTNEQLTDIGRACADDFKIGENQYICVAHHDNHEQHIHIVANRVGYDGKAVPLSNSYRCMANFCRKMEQKHNLQKVLSPRAFLTREERLIPRHDSRKERAREHIKEALQTSKSYPEFEQKMQQLGYKILKGRGISFVDDKKVKIKGSEVGFPLMKIEKIFALKSKLEEVKLKGVTPSKKEIELSFKPVSNRDESTLFETLEKEINGLIYGLLKQEQSPDIGNPELIKEAHKRKRRLGYRH